MVLRWIFSPVWVSKVVYRTGAPADRINDSGARVLITMDGAKRGGKTVNLKGIADEAIPNCPGLTHCFVAGRLDDGIASCTNKIDIDLDVALNITSADCKPTIVDSGSRFFIGRFSENSDHVCSHSTVSET